MQIRWLLRLFSCLAQCWVYVRASISGVGLKTLNYKSTPTDSSSAPQPVFVPLGSVAVGDTFLFSACSYRQRLKDTTDYVAVPQKLLHTVCSDEGFQEFVGMASTYTNYSDAYCMTHAIPYHRYLFGCDSETISTNHFLSCLRLPHMYALPIRPLTAPLIVCLVFKRWVCESDCQTI